jgi:hypothetical protein
VHCTVARAQLLPEGLFSASPCFWIPGGLCAEVSGQSLGVCPQTLCSRPQRVDMQGHGVVDRDARQNVMRHTTQKLRSVLNGERSEYHSDWLTSNRCVDTSSVLITQKCEACLQYMCMHRLYGSAPCYQLCV